MKLTHPSIGGFHISPRLALGVAAALYVAQFLLFSRFTIDDAFITFTYTKNVIQGNGLVFARGAHVEATSSMLWAILLTPFELLMPQGAVYGSKFSGMIFGLLTLLMGFRLLKYILPRERKDAALVWFALATSIASPFITWAAYGMENPLVALLLILGTFLFLVDERECTKRSIVPIFFLGTVRPEGFIYILIFSGLKILLAFASKNPKTIRSALAYLLILGCCVAAYEVWGYLYYSHLLPNTVKAKVDGLSLQRIRQGLAYSFMGPNNLFSLIFVFAIQAQGLRLWLIRPSTKANYLFYINQNQAELLMAALLASQWAFVISAGGDWMANGRLFSHALPLLIIFAVVSFGQLIEIIEPSQKRAMSATVKVMLANLIVVYLFSNIYNTRSAFAWQNNLQMSEERALTEMANYLNSQPNSDDALVAASDVGRLGYMFKGRVLDWWGLADEEIAITGQAQGRINASTVFNRKPDYIVLYSNQPELRADTMNENMAVFSRPFFDSPELTKHYTQVKSLNFRDKRWHVLFKRKEE